MGRAMQVSDHVDIALDAESIWRQVADPAQMPRWSPENTGATVPEEHRPMRAGETFEGTNLRGRARWVTESVVTSSVPGRRFAFHVRRIGVRRPQVGGSIATWVYDFDEIPGGTRVTETWIDGRVAWPNWVAALFDRVATGGTTFADFQRGNIRRTLSTMQSELEENGKP
ncbi:MAG: SRPBCC family protein [Brevibacterium yomogidense]|uniref:SRPBCC family protein n=1 Tax=Brevibacterium sp. Mu109 TaxID=1255669 RepID=UPI000C5D7BD2|nr:SRPBCC family protein [Brevibacterium sp. Mu109]SMX89483.1 Polyketide cyclase / dehydrase and lipid transport [Brevibacterium sp. Mu109]